MSTSATGGHDAAQGPNDRPADGSHDGRDGTQQGSGGGTGRRHKAGAFDIRVFIASLIGIYGVVLTIYGLVGMNASDEAKTGGVNINLYAGIGMIVVSALFLLWARMRPVVVPE